MAVLPEASEAESAWRRGNNTRREETSPSSFSPPLHSPAPPRASSPPARVAGEMDTGGGEKCGGEQPAAGADLYAVLGLRKECSDADLKVAYRKLAMKWHPDRCSSSSSTKHMEEAKEKFQQIQGAYSVLSDANKRFLYDVGVYEEEEDEDSMQGMGDFLGEMAHMMSQTRPTRQESFEELQQLFVDMFQSDIDSGFCNGPAKDQYDPFQGQTRTSSTSPSSSPSPPPPLASEVEAPSCNGINKRGSSAMGSGKPPRAGDAGAGHDQPEFCFGRQERFEELQQLFVDMFQSDIDSGFCNGRAKDQYDPFRGQTRTSSSPSQPPLLATEAETPSCNGINKRGSSAMGSGKPPRAGDAGVGHGQPEFCFGQSDAKQAPKARGGNSSRRRNGQKQKLSSKHDVSSEDEMPSPQQHRVA